MSAGLRRIAALLDHLFDAIPALLTCGFLIATSHPFAIEFTHHLT